MLSRLLDKGIDLRHSDGRRGGVSVRVQMQHLLTSHHVEYGAVLTVHRGLAVDKQRVAVGV